MKLSKAQLSKIIQPGGFTGNMLGKLAKKKTIIKFAITFAKDSLSRLVSNVALTAASNAINRFERKISGKGTVRAGKGFRSIF